VKRSTPLGFTLPELSLSMSLLALMTLAGFFMLQIAQKSFWKVTGNEDAALQLRKATRQIQRDLQVSNFSQTNVFKVPGSLPGSSAGFDSIALACLSCSTDGVGDVVTKAGGEPYWQRNVLYYLIVPQGDTCQGGIDPTTQCDDRCPHKVLVKKIIDLAPTTSPTGIPSADIETMMTGLQAPMFLSRPNRTDVSAMASEAGVSQVSVVANQLLTMIVERQPDPNIPLEVRIQLQAYNQAAGQKLVAVGTAPLSKNENTISQQLSLFPRNNN
jgi:prepilin-type N-terminal cleavage/methylation domain-containing protein